ncbi:MAG: hypothetical protein FJ291_29125 [Planctomycetes bacterium]|nr:hypothetical protein [Planctomycetota bacterium]
MQPVQARLREFTEALLGRAGALVEWPPSAEEGLALLPPEAAARLGTPDAETVRIAFAPGGEGLCANLATDFLDRVVPLLDAEPRIGSFQAPDRYLKKGDMAEAIARTFTWHNAKVVVQKAEPARVGYHAWFFLASIVSEDRWEDVLSVAVNAASGAAVPLPDPLRDLDLQPSASPPGSPASTYRQALRRAVARVEERAAPFAERLAARLERDRRRLRDYYGALLREEAAKRHTLWTHEVKDKLEARRRAVELELQRKLAELDETYALKGELLPIALIRLEVQALAVHCEVFRKQARRPHTLYWNPIPKELEPIACDACGGSTFSVVFTDDDVRPLCLPCSKAR